MTPQLRTDMGETNLILVDLGGGQNRLGASSLAQVYQQVGDRCPDAPEPKILAGFFDVVQALSAAGKLLAYHDRSDGGLFATLCEMGFAGHCGVDIEIEQPCLDPVRAELEATPQTSPVVMANADFSSRILHLLFNEEAGAVLQVRQADTQSVVQTFIDAGLGGECHVIGRLNTLDQIRVLHAGSSVLDEPRTDLQSAWARTSYEIARLRDNPACAAEEFATHADASDPGLSYALSFDSAENIAAPYLVSGIRPRVAVLREQGVNGHVEMAAAFDAAGFASVDVHMSDILSGRVSLTEFKGLAACGGFSYGDVLGAGGGWAKSILFNPRARDQFAAFFQRTDSFALGVCNGCQMMSQLHELIPGARAWPRFERNVSEQFEARFVMAEVLASPSLFFDGMAGSKMPIVVSHGEGRVLFRDPAHADLAALTIRYVDNRGVPTETYPANPNGSPGGATGYTTADGRFTILMPHPERIFRSAQLSWRPEDNAEASPWLRIFLNARKWVD